MANDEKELVERLRHLVSLNEPRHGGPYQGAAAEACVAAMAEAASTIERLSAIEQDRDALREALTWYAEQTEGCRKITREGDNARHALDADGGKRARAALNQTRTDASEGAR